MGKEQKNRMSESCLHCEFIQVIGEHVDRVYRETSEPIKAEKIVDNLVAVMAEVLAMIDDPKYRKKEAKFWAGVLEKRVEEYRTQGRYPTSAHAPVH